MLRSLSIQNYALIDSLHIAFDSGFSVITGETGAGKSIILGALSLILGQRADARHIKQGENKCIIEGVFDIPSYDLEPLFLDNDWTYDEECILRREIWATGRSRAFVNDSPVYLNDLKSLGDRLIDIHSQHRNLALQDNLFQLSVVDAMAGTEKERKEYLDTYNLYRASEKALSELRLRARANKEEEDYLRFQLEALQEASLQDEEQELLEEELKAMTHAEEIKTGLYEVTTLLSGEGESAESLLRSAADILIRVQRVYPKLEELANRVEAAYIDMKDAREEAARYFEEVDFDPARQQIVEERLSTIYGLQKKHSVQTVEELIALRDKIAEQLQGIDSLDEQLASLEKEVAEKRSTVLTMAEALGKKRRAAAPSLEKQLMERLAYVRMPNTRFQCQFTVKKEPDSTGNDTVQFVFSANKNTPLQPVAEIASGGEISRLMLCLKAMIAGATALPTIIFDEIDTGTSGEVADRVGAIMKEMSREMQVIGISHLPQIASKGDAHFVVYKEEQVESVATRVKVLTPEERVEEIARMLSGAEVTSEAIENARVMLEG
ncbi:MAG: DNA repair protein RecN [Bacteroidales bacterium]|nr:DNA repair protein RecN [Bacteroidales bacterium]